MPRTHLRGQQNILRRQLIPVGAFNLSLILRALLGADTPCKWKSRGGSLIARLFLLLICPKDSNRLVEGGPLAVLEVCDANHGIQRRCHPGRNLATYTTVRAGPSAREIS